MPKRRPHVSVNLAISLDGKITTYRRENFPLGTKRDRLRMDEIRAENDAVIIGAGTLRHDGYPILVRDDKVRRRRVRNHDHAHPINVVLSRRLDMPLNRKLWKHEETRKVVYTTKLAPARAIAKFSKVCEVVVLPRKTLSPEAVLADLYKRGCRRVLLEGGGTVHFAFAAEGVIDELFVTLTPRLIGGADAPTLMDGKGFLKRNHLELKLKSVTQIGQELYLNYLVKR